MLHCVLNASSGSGFNNLASNADAEDIPQSLVVNQFGWNTTIRAAKNHRERCLSKDLRSTFIGGHLGTACMPPKETRVACFESMDRFLRCLYGRLFESSDLFHR